MGLSYDYDICRIAGRETLSAVGANGNYIEDRENLVARFRDPKTAELLRGASPAVKKCFRDSGFSFEASESRVPAGFYRTAERRMRWDIILDLADRLEKLELTEVDFNGFDWRTMLTEAAQAQPIDMTPKGLTESAGGSRQAVSRPQKVARMASGGTQQRGLALARVADAPRAMTFGEKIVMSTVSAGLTVWTAERVLEIAPQLF